MSTRHSWATVAVLCIVAGAATTTAAAAEPAGSGEAERLVITSTSGPITGFPLQLTGGSPDAPLYQRIPPTGIGSMCRVVDGRIEHVGTGRTCILSLVRQGDGTRADVYSDDTTITFTGRYPTAIQGMPPDGFVQSADYPLRIGGGWLVSTDHASSLDLPPITGSVEVTLNGVPQAHLSLSPWSFAGSGVVDIAVRTFTAMPTGPYTVTYAYAGDAFHEPTTLTQRLSYVPNRFQPTAKKPSAHPPKRPAATRPSR